VDDTDGKLRIIFVSLTNDVGVERVIGAMAEHGARCVLLSPSGFYCAYTRFIERHVVLPRHRGMWLGTLFVHPALEHVVRHWSPDLVIPLDDVASWLLRGLAAGRRCTKPLRTLLQASLGAPSGYVASCRRLQLMRMAGFIGVRTPEFESTSDLAGSLRVAERWGYPLVLKEEFSCGGHGVTIVQDAAELRDRIETGRSLAEKSYRGLGRHLIWSIAGLPHARNAPPILQAFVEGRPAMCTASSWHGRMLDSVSFVAERVHPSPTGTSTVVRFIEHQGMWDAAHLMIEQLGCSGFVSFDFMLDESGDNAYLIEMNARPIGTSHLGRLFGHDLCEGLIACLGGETRPLRAARAQPPERIAMFPKELERFPDNLQRFLSHDLLHDVPLDDPGLVAAYLRRLTTLHHERIEAIRRILPAHYGESDVDAGATRIEAQVAQQPVLALHQVGTAAGE
jgi:hypothetical protein